MKMLTRTVGGRRCFLALLNITTHENFKFRSLSYIVPNTNILELHKRGIFQNIFPEERSPDLLNQLKGKPQCVYCGFDPTADSLHIGNLLAVIALIHCQRAGHRAVVLIGGGTAQIGDPSGKTKERPPLSLQQLTHNAECIQKNIQQIIANHAHIFWKLDKPLMPIKFVDNAEWYSQISVIEFLATIGRYFRMGTMLRRDSVVSRLSSPEGMSFTEFSYQTFQAYDWLHLYKTQGCSIQIGGNDQMGNIVSGHELISRVESQPVFGLTVPLVTTLQGDKLGKTAGNAVWLSSAKTSPFELYQYFLRLPDSQMDFYLKLFTFISDEDIDQILRLHQLSPEKHLAQKTLSEQVCLLVHGEEGLSAARRCTDVLFNNTSDSLLAMEEKELKELFHNAPYCEMLLHPGTTILDAVMKAKCFGREVDAERIIKAGGLHINNQKVLEPNHVLIPGQHILLNDLTLIKVGKKQHYIIKWVT